MARERGDNFYEEIGRKGGETVAREYGPQFYSEIGRKGGETVAREYGPEFYSEIGRKGGRTVARERGPEFYEEIGRKGGEATAREHGYRSGGSERDSDYRGEPRSSGRYSGYRDREDERGDREANTRGSYGGSEYGFSPGRRSREDEDSESRYGEYRDEMRRSERGPGGHRERDEDRGGRGEYVEPRRSYRDEEEDGRRRYGRTG